MRILCVLVRKVAPHESRNDLHRIDVDEVKAEIESGGETLIKVFLLAHARQQYHFADDGEQGLFGNIEFIHHIPQLIEIFFH